jgi:hypothetical protein
MLSRTSGNSSFSKERKIGRSCSMVASCQKRTGIKMISIHGMPTVVNTIFWKHMSASLISPFPVQEPFP